MLRRLEKEGRDTLWGLGPSCEGAVLGCFSLRGNGLAWLYFSSEGSSACPPPKQTAWIQGHHMYGTGQGLLSQMILKLPLLHFNKLQEL